MKTPDPKKVSEKNFDVQVERFEEGKLISYQTNRDGIITLNRFSSDRTSPDISDIKGTFQFVTENSQGEKILASGTLDFPVKKRMVNWDTAHSIKNISKA